MRILVVDDNVAITLSMRLLLTGEGHEVWTANTAKDALVLAAAHAPEVAFLDLGLPEVDGFELARRLRALPSGPAMGVVAVSGWGDAETRARALAAGCDEHWLKPIGYAELHAYLARR